MRVLSPPPTVVIRAARGSDGAALARLAALDSRRVPRGELLVAEQDGVLVAALALDGGARIADPFRRTDDLLALLELRAARARPRPARRWAPWRVAGSLAGAARAA